jgi:hypothetical protein
MQLEKLGIAIFFITIISASFFMFNGMFSRYGVNPDTSFNATYQKLQEQSSIINQSQEKLFGTGANQQFSFVPTIQSVMDIAGLLKNSMGIISQMIQDLSRYLHIPPVITVAIIGILTILFIFSIIKITMRITQA